MLRSGPNEAHQSSVHCRRMNAFVSDDGCACHSNPGCVVDTKGAVRWALRHHGAANSDTETETLISLTCDIKHGRITGDRGFWDSQGFSRGCAQLLQDHHMITFLANISDEGTASLTQKPSGGIPDTTECLLYFSPRAPTSGLLDTLSFAKVCYLRCFRLHT
jgi:hypothetical protein